MWAEYRREFCLDRWELEDQPSPDEKRAVYLCLMRLREDPRQHAFAVRIPDAFPETWVADAPGTDLVCVLYSVYEAEHAIEYLMIERI